MSMIGHNNPPQKTKKSFGACWLEALWGHPEINVYSFSIGWMVHKFMDRQGRGVALSNSQIAKATGMSESSAQRGKTWLVKNGFIEIEARGQKVGSQTGVKTKIRAILPANEAENPSHTEQGTMLTQSKVEGDHSHTEQHHSHTDHGNHSHTDHLIREEYSGSNSGNKKIDRDIGLNGSTHQVAHDLSVWIYRNSLEGRYAPNEPPQIIHVQDAESILKSFVSSYGGEAVKRGHAEMLVKMSDGGVVGNPLPLFRKMCEDQVGKIKRANAKPRKVVRA